MDVGGCPKAPKQLTRLAPAAVAGSLTTTFTLVTPHEESEPSAERTAGVIKNPLPKGGPLVAKLPAHICQMRSLCK
jgi:hypothetical protein